jgi:hypothetical protein
VFLAPLYDDAAAQGRVDTSGGGRCTSSEEGSLLGRLWRAKLVSGLRRLGRNLRMHGWMFRICLIIVSDVRVRYRYRWAWGPESLANTFVSWLLLVSLVGRVGRIGKEARILGFRGSFSMGF